MKRDRSNAGAKLSIPEPREGTEGTLLALQSTAAGTWEIRPLTSEHRLSLQSRELLGIGRYEPVSIRRLLAALHPDDREIWKDAVARALDPERRGHCFAEFRTAGPAERWLAASGYAFFEGLRAVRVFGTLHPIE